MLRCSSTQVFRLLRSGKLRHGPNLGRETMVTLESVRELARPRPTVKESRRHQKVSRTATRFEPIDLKDVLDQ